MSVVDLGFGFGFAFVVEVVNQLVSLRLKLVRNNPSTNGTSDLGDAESLGYWNLDAECCCDHAANREGDNCFDDELRYGSLVDVGHDLSFHRGLIIRYVNIASWAPFLVEENLRRSFKVSIRNRARPFKRTLANPRLENMVTAGPDRRP